MAIFSVLVFLAIMLGLGFTVLRFSKEDLPKLEKISISLALGLAAFTVLGVVLNFVNVPIDWKIFLAFALAYPLFLLVKNHKKLTTGSLDFNFKIKKSALFMLPLLLIVLGSLMMYAGGAFKYPYLENDDPWVIAGSTKYVAVEKTLDAPDNFKFKYLNPYPPAYSMLLGVTHQTNDSLYWNLKFFNGLILSLSILFFYYFAKEFTQSKRKAMFATFVLASLPSFFTHFIWAHSLVVLFIFPAAYCLEKARQSKRWVLIAALPLAAIMLTQPSQALKIALMFGIYFGVKLVYDRRHALRIFSAGILGALVSLLWWHNKITSQLFGRSGEAAVGEVLAQSGTEKSASIISWIIQGISNPSSGTATRAYTFQDFFYAQPFGGINVQVGWGIAASLLLALGLVYVLLKNKSILTKKNNWILITSLWFVYFFLAVNAMTFNLPFGFITFRFWLLLAIPVALLSALGLEFILNFAKKKEVKLGIVLFAVLAVLLTSTQQKYTHNTLSGWPPGVSWTSMEELQAYGWLNNLPADAKIFSPSATSAMLTLGFDKFTCLWCAEDIQMREQVGETNQIEFFRWLVDNDYEYLIVGGRTVTDLTNTFGDEAANKFMSELVASIQAGGMYNVAFQNQGAVVLEVLK